MTAWHVVVAAVVQAGVLPQEYSVFLGIIAV